MEKTVKIIRLRATGTKILKFRPCLHQLDLAQPKVQGVRANCKSPSNVAVLPFVINAQTMRRSMNNLPSGKQALFCHQLFAWKKAISSFVLDNKLPVAGCATFSLALLFAWQIATCIEKSNLLSKSAELYANKNWNQLLAVSSDGISHFPSAPKFYSYKASALEDLGKPAEALATIEKAVRLDPNNLETLADRARLLLAVGHYSDAIRDYNRVLSDRNMQKSAGKYANRAVAECAEHKFADALKDLDIACRLEPTKTSFLQLRAFAAGRLNHSKQAISDLNKVIEINQNPIAIAEKAFIEFQAKDLKNANLDIQLSLYLKPTSTAYYYRALFRRAQGHNGKALLDLNQAAKLAPTDTYILQERARCYAAEKNYAAAIADYDHLQSISKGPFCYIERAKVEQAAESYKRASEDFTAVLSQNPNDKEAILGDAICREKLGQLVKASELCDQLLNINKTDVTALELRAEINQKQNHIDAAKKDFAEALSNNCHSVKALIGYAAIDEQEGKYAVAKEKYKRVLAIDSNNQIARTKLAEVTSKEAALKTTCLDSAKNGAIDLRGSAEELQRKGYHCLTINLPSLAVTFLAESVKRDPEDITSRRYLAYALTEAHMPQEAVTQFQVLKRISKLTKDELYKYACALRGSGEYSTALGVTKNLFSEERDFKTGLLLAQIYRDLDMKETCTRICNQCLQMSRTSEQSSKVQEILSSLNCSEIEGAPQKKETLPKMVNLGG
jgi:tetratricopeptide (TPR) repeat protein